MGIGSGLIMLGVLGTTLIWKGVTGDVMITPMGSKIIPGWMYVLAGIVLLCLPLLYIFIRTEAGKSFFGM
ncbi:MAG: hypothetical protein JJU29_10680 [Verrucomicrobia bacterium]|nr:hypothetical protein [Verrucomicrobiota bacterium]MCH8511920.1 hypothetical protein [Kiritimatiellia bacterium]